MATHRILYLYAEMTSKKEYRSRMRACEHILESRKLMDFTVKFDGSDPEHKVLRNSMFKASGRRGEYPQLFLQPLTAELGFGSDLEFAGGYHEIQALNENEDEHRTLSAQFARATGVAVDCKVDLKALKEAASLGDTAVARALAAAQSEADGAVPDASVEPVAAAAAAAAEAPVAEAVERSAAASDAAAATEAAGETAASAWEALLTDEGEEYYHNSETGETQWTKPAEMGGSDWQRFLDDSGKEYFFHRVSGETTWDRPAEMDA